MNSLVWVIVLVVVLGGAFFLWQMNAPDALVVPTPSPVGSAPTPSPGSPTPAPSGSDAAPMSATVTFNGMSFSPSAVIIKRGGTVTWVNNSNGAQMWVASDVHPSHTTYAGTARTEHCPDTAKTAFDQCTGGGNYSFTFDKLGTWRYHDHITPGATGRVEVVE